ncbi:MAG: DUF1624 domain-containing protein [Archaeoglobaceae archaeon]|nr:DUF1624 domain-containing protein [Archaeoglobaceae archaeon]MCX8151744.1 DUF1624 domain-containing protein [Archaeoglobaceae archaeon]MDW8014286.1 heparan-alpha-glucosaminide N-acetyltransferase [Archaeoglobaceae archaeon]
MRFWEIDFARGVAVILMLVYHFFFDFYFFGKVELSEDFLFYFPRFVGAMFIFISGYTMSVVKPGIFRVLRKILKLTLLAITISFVTFILFKEKMVYFGILHFFALATLISIPFVKRPKISALAGIFLISLGQIDLRTDNYYLLWLGVAPRNFTTLDYYPLIPNLGYMLLGIFAGSYHKPLNLNLKDPVSFLGKNSLKVYLIQHPLIFLVLCLIYPDVLESFVDIVELN